jgi:gliding motility-associated-like protein
MKIILSFLTLFIFTSYSQNLVVNPSFEITNTNCVNFGGEGFRTDLNPSWDNANSNIPGDSCSSPELFSACNTIFGGAPGPTFMPDATSFGIGWQYSRTGTRHAGLIAYESVFGLPDEYKEYIQGHTSTPLTAGQTYCVSFYVSLADGSPYAVQDLGVFFSNTQYLRDACSQGARIAETPQLINTCGVLADTMNWVRLQWDYVATGGEQYFIIGNFNTSAATTVAPAGGSGFGNYFAYYFIDDVSIEATTCCYADILNQSTLCITDSPVTLTATGGLGGNCSSTPVGTWAGPGITNASTGAFDPAIAGIGTHAITFTMSCGYVANTTITVSPCTGLTVCLEANGDFTVSDGVGPYTWQETIAPGSTPITNQTQCTACGYSWVAFTSTCLNGFTPVTTCNSPGGLQNFATGTTITPSANFPIQVTDNTGTTYLINSAGSLTACTSNLCPTLTANITSQTNVNCFGQSTCASTVSAGNGTAPYTYTWVPGSLNGATQTGLASGNYTVNILDDAGCPGTINVNITQPSAALSATVNTTPTGFGTSTGSATVNVSGGTSNYTFVWSNSASTTSSATGLAAGPGTVTITDALGCQIIENFSITAPGAPTLSISNIVGVNCSTSTNGSATVSASGGTAPLTYLWTPSGENTATATGLSAGNNTITVTDAAGCSASEIVNIPAPAPIVLSETITPTNCGAAIGEISVSATGGTGTLTYTWTPNAGTGATLSNLIGGMYDLTVTDDNGCSVSETYEVDVVGSLPVIASPTSIQVDAGDTVQLFASGATNYTWSPATGLSCTNCSNPVASPTETTVYTVTGTDAFGCSGQATVMILIQTVCGDIFIPTIFSPNGDGNNDIQCVMGNCIATMKYSIYDRWGEKVFKTETQSECWDGMFRNKELNSGTFAYKFNATLIDGTAIEQSGNLTLVR